MELSDVIEATYQSKTAEAAITISLTVFGFKTETNAPAM